MTNSTQTPHLIINTCFMTKDIYVKSQNVTVSDKSKNYNNNNIKLYFS